MATENTTVTAILKVWFRDSVQGIHEVKPIFIITKKTFFSLSHKLQWSILEAT